jgi:Uma2 family endonuclease
LPAQGSWTEANYLDLDTNQLVEFSHGFVEFLLPPTIGHQRILKSLFNSLHAFVAARNLGEVFFRGVPVRLAPGIYRQPDLLFLKAENSARLAEKHCEGADLVMEIVSDGEEDRRRDLQRKRDEYAKAGIPEYWIVDPRLGSIVVLTLDGSSFGAHGSFTRGEFATSKLLSDFAVDVTSTLAGTL